MITSPSELGQVFSQNQLLSRDKFEGKWQNGKEEHVVFSYVVSLHSQIDISCLSDIRNKGEQENTKKK